MKRTTEVGKISTQNEGVFKVLYNQAYQKIDDYIKEREDVLESDNTISAYSLYNILKEYYSGLEKAMGADSEELKQLVDDINSYMGNGSMKVIGVRKKNKLLEGLDNLLDKIKESKQKEEKGKRYLDIRFYIRQDSTCAVLNLVEDEKYKKVIVCRDLVSKDLYYGKGSVTDYEAIDFAYDKLIELFDTIDGYRESLPEQIDADIALDDLACNPYEYANFSVPFGDDVISGEVLVNSNGYVDLEVDLTRENKSYRYVNDYSRNLKELISDKSMDLLKKVSIDVNTLEEPIKGIVVASLEEKKEQRFKFIG